MRAPTFRERGKLELDKCALYTIQWMFSEDGIAKLKTKQTKNLSFNQAKQERNTRLNS